MLIKNSAKGTRIPGFWPEIENSTFFMMRIGKTIMNILQIKREEKLFSFLKELQKLFRVTVIANYALTSFCRQFCHS